MKIIVALFLVCAFSATGLAQQNPPQQQNNTAASPTGAAAHKSAEPASAVDPAKEAAIRRLFEVVGTKALVNQTVATMSESIKPVITASLPPGDYRAELVELFFQRFQSKFTGEQLLSLSVPVYDKHFSLEEIEGLTKFYQSPLGKKAASVLPQVVSECQEVGRKLGSEIGEQSMTEILAERPDLKKSLEEAAANRKNP